VTWEKWRQTLLTISLGIEQELLATSLLNYTPAECEQDAVTVFQDILSSCQTCANFFLFCILVQDHSP
jgi:hypothetical protein